MPQFIWQRNGEPLAINHQHAVFRNPCDPTVEGGTPLLEQGVWTQPDRLRDLPVQRTGRERSLVVDHRESPPVPRPDVTLVVEQYLRHDDLHFAEGSTLPSNAPDDLLVLCVGPG